MSDTFCPIFAMNAQPKAKRLGRKNVVSFAFFSPAHFSFKLQEQASPSGSMRRYWMITRQCAGYAYMVGCGTSSRGKDLNYFRIEINFY